MPRRDVRMYLADIVESGHRIRRHTDSISFEQYAADEDVRLIVERSFEMIGEALRQAIACDPRVDPAITDARRIIDFRNFLIHAYHLVDHTVVWDIIATHLPRLLDETTRLLNTITADLDPPSASKRG